MMSDLEAKREMFLAKVEKMRQQYIETLRMRHSNLRSIRKMIGDDGPTESDAEQFRQDIHKTSGTAKSFGYPKLSESAAIACASIEQFKRGSLGSQKVLHSLDQFLTEMEHVLAEADRGSTTIANHR